MAAERYGQNHDLAPSQKADRRTGVAPPESQSSTESEKPTYQVILRHLARFRDGARAVLAFFDSGHPDETNTAVAVPPPPAASTVGPAPAAVREPVKSPMQRRIERHMGLVDQALKQIHSLNPEHKQRIELPQEARELIATKRRTIRDIVNAELHFWAATIENNPLSKFDDTEQVWIARIIRLANTLGVEPDRQEHLAFLKDWASHKHH
jgi:hypothetical protein